MSEVVPYEDKAKKERSPSYPFISLRKAEERARVFWEKHRREGARLSSVAHSWGYALKSSGLQQTVAALKQYGLIEDLGSGEDRKIQLTDLGRRLVADQRHGAREAALKEAALRPRLFQEYSRWVTEMPSENHCLSELELDRGFNAAGAKLFLRVFIETISYASLRGEDSEAHSLSNKIDQYQDISGSNPIPDNLSMHDLNLESRKEVAYSPYLDALPFAKRLKVEVTGHSLVVNAILLTPSEVDKLIRILQANKQLFEVENAGAEASPGTTG